MLPQPLTDILAKVDEDPQPFRRVLRLVDGFEWVVKWCTTLAVSDLFRTVGFSDRTKLLASEGLRTPSLGTWVRFLRAALDELPPDSPWRTWDRVIDAEHTHRIVAFRNEYAHGAVPSDDRCIADFARFRPVLDELLDSPCLSVELLPASVGRELRVDGRTAVVSLSAPERVLDLWPLALYLPHPDRPGDHAFHFFNALRAPKIETLNYDLPDRQRRRELWDEFHRVLPLAEWRRSLHELEPFKDDIQFLTDNFKGRDAERTRLVQFFLRRGMLFMLGPPGIGKSAAVAHAIETLRREENRWETQQGSSLADPRPHLIEHFIRRGQASARPTNFLLGMLRRLDTLYGFEPHRPSVTDDELFDQFKTRVAMIRADPTVPPLVLIIDGLDEGPDVGSYLVRGDARVGVLCTGRRSTDVLPLVDRWMPDGATRMELGALDESAVRAILYDVVDKYDERLSTGYVAALAERADGNPLFLTLYAQELFRDPEKLGDLTLLPDGLSTVLATSVRRVCDDGRDVVTFNLLCCLAVAKEPLDTEVLAKLLDVHPFRIDTLIDECSELLTESTSQHRPGPHLQLFHETLREWFERHYPTQLVEASERFGTVAADRAGTPSEYFRRWGLRHLVELVEHGASAWLPDAIAEVNNPDRLEARIRSVELDVLARDLLAVYRWSEPATRQEIEHNMGVVLLRDLESGDAIWSPEVLHSLFAYRSDTTLYDAVLEHVNTSEFAESIGVTVPPAARAGLLHCLGTRQRRQYGPQGRAKSTLEQAALLSAASPDRPSASRIHYDLAYLHFLTGDVAAALDGFEASRSAAEDTHDIVAVHIARCLQVVVQWHARAERSGNIAAVLLEALPVFIEHADVSRTAERWVTNVYLHLFDLALERRDHTDASRLLAEAETSPWSRRYSTPSRLDLHRARLDLCRGEFSDAVTRFEQYFADLAGQHANLELVEQLARTYLELGSALLSVGRSDDADQARHTALQLPPTAGNWMWQSPRTGWPPVPGR